MYEAEDQLYATTTVRGVDYTVSYFTNDDTLLIKKDSTDGYAQIYIKDGVLTIDVPTSYIEKYNFAMFTTPVVED